MNNKNIKTVVIAGLACMALCGTALAAPKGGHGGRAPQKAPAHQKATRQMLPARGPGGGNAAKPAPVRHKAPPAQHVRAAKPAPHKAAPARHKAAYRPHYRETRHWARPVCPPPCYGARRVWTWIDTAWEMIIDGICYYGDGYYYDGYNYYYNGAYYTTPPVIRWG